MIAHESKKQEKLDNNRQDEVSNDTNGLCKCLKCGKLFANGHELNMHMKTHKIYECSECSAIFKSSNDKKLHFESEHRRSEEQTQKKEIGEL